MKPNDDTLASYTDVHIPVLYLLPHFNLELSDFHGYNLHIILYGEDIGKVTHLSFR